MKKITLLIFGIVLISCNKKETPEPETIVVDSLATAKVSENLVIAPGEKIGNTMIGANAETLSALGQPDLSDAAMGKAWMSWFSKNPNNPGTELMVSTGYKDSEMKEKTIREIRVNSPDFKTAGGNGVGNTVLDIVEEFPNIKATTAYSNIKTGQEVEVFDDQFSGIAFEIQKEAPKKCIAIIIHEKDKPVRVDYTVLHSEFQLKDVDNF
ncbi:hypothetical protein FNO01nite_31800 [Flavobacterium noncentrifugens]|uniref:Lipoprotein n=1 Tax=Flavobacterium noncentrifugens TaxID=1128970 RepID=A0A1G9D3B3_9FLAO|nr:hypothetical protein [Flavobacterium noncentrifugens]GEP52508.1 hypothetical protein FNO01nite_31800 [Flavobacterium noncentrifugens]SDK58420.1 hypothetical protein SAMN04487935_3706 [Flavobacterium noncentrifugens]